MAATPRLFRHDEGLMLRSNKPNRCKHCKQRMPEDKARHVLHEGCKDKWIKKELARQAARRKKDAEAKAKVARAQDRRRREALKTIPELKKEAQAAFNAFIRARDANQPCICCGLPLGAGEVGGAYDCGHYRSVGSADHLRYNELNAHAQRKQCNRWGAGRAVDYRIGLIARIGLEAVEALESSNDGHKWRREELIEIRDRYRAKTKMKLKELE